jgi:lipid-A-disaccharide synthase
LLAASDRIITPFPWSAEILTKAGSDAVFLGHPLLDVVRPISTREQFFSAVGDVSPNVRVIGLLPGSRTHEIANILPAMIDAGKLIFEKIPSVGTFIIAAGSDRSKKEIECVLARMRPGKCGLEFRIVQGQTYDVMTHSDLLLTCSGTATLEAMILGTPMIIIYRGTKLMKLEYLLRKAIFEQFIGMPNIIAGKQVCQELLGDDASPEAIAELAISYLQNPAELERIKQDLNAAKHVLGEPGGTTRAAKVVLETAGLLPLRHPEIVEGSATVPLD